ncbi:MAG: hypothetical protein PVJ32_06575 [Anaerolineales bacterium]|jgi:hypothetical protein
MNTDRGRVLIWVGIALALATGVSACTPGEQQVYGLGDVVDVGSDQRWVLSSVAYSDDVLEAGFTVENTGTENTGYNLVISLQARNTQGDPLSQVMFCGSNLDGSLQPGETATGVICWNTEGDSVVRIHFLILLTDSNIIWEVVR